MNFKLLLLCTVISYAAAQSAGDACSKDGSIIPSSVACKNYLECDKGKYVKKECSFWQLFDTVENECRWGPTAKCLKGSVKEPQKNKDKTDKGHDSKGQKPKQKPDESKGDHKKGDKDTLKCDDNGLDKCSKTVAVIDHCQYYCFCGADKKLSKPVKCIMDRYYDSTNDMCVEDTSVCQATPATIPAGAKCSESKATKRAPGNCKSYMECNGRTWEQKDCSFGYYYNSKSKTCEANWLKKYCNL